MSVHFIDPLDWYRNDFQQARLRGDERRQELANIFDLFAKHQRENPQHALHYLREGIALAGEMGATYWELLFEYWLYTRTAPATGDVSAIVRLFMKAQQPPYRDCPTIGRIYGALIDAYTWADPVSYAPDIREAIRYTLDNIPIGHDTYQRIMMAKLRLHYELREYETIQRTAKTLMRYADRYPQDAIVAQVMSAQAALHLGELRQAASDSGDALLMAQAQDDIDLQRAALTVQSAVLAKEGDSGSAAIARERMRELDWRGAKWLDISFDAEILYWQHTNMWWGGFLVLHFARQVLDYYQQHGSPYWECRARFTLIETMLTLNVFLRFIYRLLLGVPPLDRQVREARLAAEQLVEPDWYLERLHEITPE